LAHCYVAIAAFTNTTSKDTVPKIRDAAAKALALDSRLGEAHLDLGIAYTYDYHWSMADEEYKKALELSPGVAFVHQRYGDYLRRIGRFEDSLAESQKARALDPVSPTANTAVARPFYFMRRYDEAQKQYKVALELAPDLPTLHEYIGIAYMMQGMSSQGIAELEFAHDRVPNNVWYAGLLGWADALAGKPAAAHRILDTLLQQSVHEASPSMAIAHVYMGLGNKDQAFEWLGKAIDQRNVNMFLLKTDPMYDPLRSDPRFLDLLRRMNLL
jgi:Tfp pilus assembly protein PilF